MPSFWLYTELDDAGLVTEGEDAQAALSRALIDGWDPGEAEVWAYPLPPHRAGHLMEPWRNEPSRTAADVYREALAAFVTLRDDPATSHADQAIAASEARRILHHLASLTLAGLTCAACGGGVALGWTPGPGWRTTPSPVCREECARWVHNGPAAGARRHLPRCCCAGREPESLAHECRCGCIQLQPPGPTPPHHGKPGFGP